MSFYVSISELTTEKVLTEFERYKKNKINMVEGDKDLSIEQKTKLIEEIKKEEPMLPDSARNVRR